MREVGLVRGDDRERRAFQEGWDQAFWERASYFERCDNWEGARRRRLW